MSIRRTILATSAVVLILAGCAGTADDTTPVDAAASTADQDDDTDETAATAADQADDTAPEGTDGAAATTEDSTEESAVATEEDGHGDEGHTDDDADDHADDAATEVAAGEEVDRVVEIDMQDIAFSTDELEFTVGERVKFVFDNVGEAPHEALIGDMHLQEEHETEMAEGAGHGDGGHHGEMSMISLESGESGSLVHEFTEAGELWMGCHVPGHWGAGMQTRITVTS